MRVFQPRYLLHGHVHIKNKHDTRHPLRGNDAVINVFPYVQFDFESPPSPDAIVMP